MPHSEFHHNHYVPEWYQKRFIPGGKGKYWYLDLRPERIIPPDGKPIISPSGKPKLRNDLLNWGPDSCFEEYDLYTTKWGTTENTNIKQFFFGRVDENGKAAVEFFSNFCFDTPGQDDAFNNLMRYMSIQKLRTPKGLGWLSSFPRGRDHNPRLMLLQEIQQLYCGMWSDCVWQIADAKKSATKFIISDHPVTVYNRACFPLSAYCKGYNDPDIRWVATHTYFLLSLEKILILTNLSWVRNPYQNERRLHPNQRFFHDTIFSLEDIQTYRNLSEQEVREINYITKKRALRYIAGAEKEWLYPERYLSNPRWNRFGNGWLLMPEPREVYMGGETMVRYNSGHVDIWNEYGQRPWERGYKDKERDSLESQALSRFQAEFAVMQGPEYRGTSGRWHHRFGDGPHVASEEFHKHDIERAERYRVKCR